MAVVLGTSSGFVSAQPTADPDGGQASISSYIGAQKDVCPAGITTITEIGWYQSASNNEAMEYSCGIYSHDGVTDHPNALIATQSSGQSTTLNTAGWCRYTGLSIAVTAATTYWIATGGRTGKNANKIDSSASAGKKRDYRNAADNSNVLVDPWVDSGGSNAVCDAHYALCSAGGASIPAFIIGGGLGRIIGG
jgi:hypothetical protein